MPSLIRFPCLALLATVIACAQGQPATSEANHPTPVDHNYEHLRVGMRDLFTALGIAA